MESFHSISSLNEEVDIIRPVKRNKKERHSPFHSRENAQLNKINGIQIILLSSGYGWWQEISRSYPLYSTDR